MGESVHRAQLRSGAEPARSTPRRARNEQSLYARSGQRKYLTAEERQRFIAAAEAAAPEVRTLCLTLVFIGCHLSEALALTAIDVEAESGLVAIRSLNKRGRLAVRQVPAPAALLSLLSRVHGLHLENGRKSATGLTIDPYPVVKLFTPDANCTWLLTELDPTDEDIAFWLCDLGLGFPELGMVSLTEIASVRGREAGRLTPTSRSCPAKKKGHPRGDALIDWEVEDPFCPKATADLISTFHL